MLANERFVAKRRPHVVEAEREKLERYRRELEALAGRTDVRRSPTSPRLGGACSPVAAPDGFGLERMQRSARARSATRSRRYRRARRRHERQVDRDRDDRAAARSPTGSRSARRSRPTSRRGPSGSGSTARRRTSGGARPRPAGGRGGRGDPVRGRSPPPRSPRSPTRRSTCAVVEAGLGGRHDATNVLRSRVVLLTNVGLEHTDVLGETVEEIATEKLAVVHTDDTIVVLPDDTFARARRRRARSSLGGAREAAEAFVGHRIAAAVERRAPGRLERRDGRDPRRRAQPGRRRAGSRDTAPGRPTTRSAPRSCADKDVDEMLAGCSRGSATGSSRPRRRTRARSPPPSSPSARARHFALVEAVAGARRRARVAPTSSASRCS